MPPSRSIALRDIAFLVGDLLFPSYVCVTEIVVLGMVSKRLLRFLDAQKTVAQVWLHKLAVPKTLKLSTLLGMRKNWHKIVYSLSTEQNLTIKESCALCFLSPHTTPNVRIHMDATVTVRDKCRLKERVCALCVASPDSGVRM